MSLPKKTVHVYIVSDSTGMTAERVISAVVLQFKSVKPVFKRFPYIKTKKQLESILTRAQERQGIVIYSLVSQELRKWMNQEKRTRDVYTIDLLGPLLKQMARLWNMIPAFRPGLLKGVGEASIRLAEAIDFTLRHDDGQGINTLGKADLILIGVSRTSKTPTSLYLSCNNGLKVANVPIVPHVEPPQKIFTLKRRKVGLTIAPERLAFIRQKRLKYVGSMDYTDLSSIREELAYSHAIFERIGGIQVIDVTHSSIEEVANKIV
ncbi:MAG: kinase/pyrophosphorylase [Deltaproteobacteria bacterium]|nr:kinase/pyrophosphorylase [Deltaproteobacteria bacterium]